MALRKTIGLLPEIFRTEKNEKFLNATIDQLVTPSVQEKINAFVGRKFAPSFSAGDQYVNEVSDTRQNYQLEPGVVFKEIPETGTSGDRVEFLTNYVDMVNAIEAEGGDTNNHDRLFENEYYSWSSFFDFDKFVNFSQYYWLPNGPDSIPVFSSVIDSEENFDITRVDIEPSYFINDRNSVNNPTIKIARGGSYTFTVDQLGFPFYIQTEPGLDGLKDIQDNISTRDILGIENNGEDVGVVTFNVPAANAQNKWIGMTKTDDVDFATRFSYTEIHNQVFTTFIANNPDGIDGITDQREIENATIVFYNVDENQNEEIWEAGGLFDTQGVGFDANGSTFDPTNTISLEDRHDVYRISIDANDIMTVVRVLNIPQDEKIFILKGSEFGNKELWKNAVQQLELVPVITAPLTRFFYADGIDPLRFGIIDVVEQDEVPAINVDEDIIGRNEYISPNAVELTNGMKIDFNSDVTPVSYAGNEYYVEGVGQTGGIRLVSVDDLVVPEPFTTTEEEGFDTETFDSAGWAGSANAPLEVDYFTINRSSVDRNAWSRSNRWFHIDVIEKTAAYNDFNFIVDQDKRANRPIIEFEPDLQLFNYGKIFNRVVNVFDETQIDALSNVEGQSGYFVDGIPLLGGTTVIFGADRDPLVRSKIYEVSFIDTDSDDEFQLHLTEVGDATNDDVILISNGATRQGIVFYYNDDVWLESQQKTNINQTPYFDIFDTSGNSFGDESVYFGTGFTGTRLFSYQQQPAAVEDPVLGFGLSYKNFENVGDIIFENNYVRDAFTYSPSNIIETTKINDGFVHKIIDRDTDEIKNDWTKVNRNTRQFSIQEYLVTADETQVFQSPTIPKNENDVVNLFVYKNSKLLKRDTTQNVTNFIEPEYTTLEQDGNFFVVLAAPADVDDYIVIRAYSDVQPDFGYYEIPSNLENNATNTEFTTLTLGQIRNHITIASNNSTTFFGNSPGNSNLRDVTNLKSYAGNILQHSAGAHLGAFLLNNGSINKDNNTHVHDSSIIRSIDYSRREYSKYKQKLYDAISTMDLNFDDIPAALDAVINELKIGKSETFPFFYSDMLGYGEDAATAIYAIENPDIRTYDYGLFFDINDISNRSVLVYHNGVQIYVGTDFVFDTVGANITFDDGFVLAVDDIIEIIDYSNTDGSFIPPTPTKMGLYPKFRPEIYTDDTYRTPKTVIQGHDGSIFVAFNDSRDDIILEFEKRIYNNIKTTYTTDVFDVNELLPGKFRDSDYTREEVDSILSLGFLNWAIVNKVDYSAQIGFDVADKFTWNWSNFQDKIDGDLLPGHWRGIYRYFYDTDRPHSHPWEMLGQSEKPTWWDDRYGIAPYTKGNEVMWEDLRDGKLYQDVAGTDFTILADFVRPDLKSFIPVDATGNLADPLQSVVGAYNTTYVEESFVFGDVGPAEAAWRRSSEYPYAIMKLSALTRPSKFAATRFDSGNIVRDKSLDQIVDRHTLKRITSSDIVLHGTETNGTVNRVNGISQFVSDWARHKNVSLDNIIKVIRALELQLVYRVGGYTDKRFLKVLAEQVSPTSTNKGIFVPDDDFDIELTKSAPIARVSLSGVIIEKTNNGWAVRGYDIENPYFDIIPSSITDNNYQINTGGVRAIVYNDFRNEVIRVPYNTEFTNTQQVVDFFVSYQRYLELRGFVFNEQLEETNGALSKDWILSAKEYLFWQSQGWENGATITLNPVSDKVTFNLFGTVPDDLAGDGLQYKVLNQNLKPIRFTQLKVSRIDNLFTVQATDTAGPIYLLEVNPVQYEHTIVFNNRTVFNDIIYLPELGSRQFRLKLIGTKTSNWDGSFQAPGYIFNQPVTKTWSPGVDYKRGDFAIFRKKTWVAIKAQDARQTFEQEFWRIADNIKTGLRPNLDTAASIFGDFYNMDSVNNEGIFDRYGKGLIGYQKRDYLENLELDDVSQVKFYQGMIKQKGTASSIDKLIRAQLDNQDSDINFFEEWGFRVGEYGAIDANQVIEIELNENEFVSNPELIEFLDNGDTRPQHISYIEDDLYKTPNEYSKDMFTTRSGSTDTKKDITYAGFPRLSDIDVTIFDIANVADLNAEFVGSGYTIWTARNTAGVWDVYRVSETANRVTNVIDILDNQIKVTTSKSHNLTTNDFVVMRNTSSVDGFYRVDSIVSNVEFVVTVDASGIDLENIDGLLFTLESIKYDEPKDIASFNPIYGWQTKEKVWLENDADGKWQVLEKQSPWDFSNNITYGGVSGNDNLGTSFASSEKNLWAVAGLPNSGTGKAINCVKTATDDLTENALFDPSDVTGINGFGTSVDVGDEQYIVVGAPLSSSETGMAVIYKKGTGNVFSINQVLRPSNITSGDKFGQSVAISNDEKWIYIGASGSSEIYAYNLQDVISSNEVVQTEAGDGIKTSASIFWFPESEDNLQIIDSNGRILVPYVDFTVSGNTVNFTFTLTNSVDYVMRRIPMYRHISTIERNADVEDRAADAMGTNIDTNGDGTIIVTGAPNRRYFGTDSAVLSNAGAAYIFERTKESFIGDGTTDTFTPSGTLPPVNTLSVYIDNEIQTYTVDLTLTSDDSQFGQYTLTGNTVEFRNAPSENVIVKIDVNNFVQVQRLQSTDPTDSDLYGSSVVINSDTTGNWIAIGSPGEDRVTTNTGSVFVYLDRSKKFGTVTGTSSPTISSGDKIRINDIVVTTTGTTLTTLVSDINNAGISGITAADTNGLTIVSESKIENNKLRVMPLTGNTYGTLGIEPYTKIQEISHPRNAENETFGLAIDLNAAGDTLVVGSKIASTINTLRFDVDADDLATTVFDNNSTYFFDRELQSGAVYVYDLLASWNETIDNPSQFGFTQQLQSETIESFDEFGTSVHIRDTKIIVGSPKYDTATLTNSGIFYEYENPTLNKGWVDIRGEDDKIDVSLFNKAFIYSRRNNEIIEYLDWIDPAKGKVSGLAQQELAYTTERDPASYNVNTITTNILNTRSPWGINHVGKLWWDVSTVRYVDYEQGELDYRASQWAAKFPGSSTDVYEWVESNTLPSVYSGDGTPKFADDSSYTERVSFNNNTGIATTKYYFWVKDKTSAPNVGFRKLDSSTVARIIDNPKTYGLKFLSVIKSNSIIAYNLAENIEDNNTVLHINYDVIKNSNVLHSEYQLVAEGDSTSVIADKIYNKFVDSLAATNSNGDSVPQRGLSVAERYGVLYRPRQTMFVDRTTALELFVTFCNEVFGKYQIANQFDLSRIESADPIPGERSGAWAESVDTFAELSYLNPAIYANGYKVLVLGDENYDNLWSIYEKQSDNTWILTRIQAYDTNNYWQKTTWYADGFNENTVVTFAVETEQDLNAISDTLSAGELVKIKSNDLGVESIVQFNEDGSFEEVVVEDGTIEFLPSLYDNTVEVIGFDNSAFDNSLFDKLPTTEIRQIVEAVKNDIFVEDIRVEWNRLWFTMVEYLLTEQPYADWLIKTSFIKVVQKLRGLDQYPSYQRDNQDYISDYIAEAKPYRTNVREYILEYTKDDPWNGDVTDFDVHSYFDSDLGYYRKPSGEKASDFALWEQGLNVPWGDNYGYSVGSTILLNSGIGYTIPPVLTVTGGGGSGAIIEAKTNGSVITQLTVINEGNGYTTTPTVEIDGVGTGLEIYLQLTNGKVREFDSILKFDRIAYSSDIVEWEANTAYTAAQIISYLGEAYEVVADYTSSATFDASNLTVYADGDFTSAADRIAAYYTPTEGMIGNDITQLQIGTDYPGVRVYGPDFNANPGFDVGAFDVEEFDAFEIDENGIAVISGASSIDSIIRSTYSDAALGVAPEDIDIVGGKYIDVYNSHSPEEFVPGIMFDTLDLKVFTLPGQDQEFDGNAARIYTEFHVSDGSTASFGYKGSSSVEDVDNIFVWTALGGVQYQDIDFTVDYTNGIVTFVSVPVSNDTIYIYSFSNTGENPVAEKSFTADGITDTFTVPIDPDVVEQGYVLVDGVRSLNPNIVVNGNFIDVVLSSTPTAGQHVHIVLYDVDPDVRQAFSEVTEQLETSDGSTRVITLDNTSLYAKPFEANMIVEVNGSRLRPANAVYYSGDGNTITFNVPTSAQETQALVQNSDIIVGIYDQSVDQYRNLVAGQDYTTNAYDGSSIRSITFIGDDSAARTPTTQDTVVIGITTDAEYTVSSDGTTLTIDAGVTLAADDIIRIVQFANHDPQRIQTNVFKGVGTEQRFTLDRPVTNTDYLWVTVDGTKLHSAVDYSVLGSEIIIADSTTLTASSIIVVSGFSEKISQPSTGFRIFNDMLGNTEYYRITQDNTTTLVQEFTLEDDVIYVENATSLAPPDTDSGVPGFLMIAGERITYWERDTDANTVSRLRRGTQGTGAKSVHALGSNVFDVSGQQIPGNTHTQVWYTSGDGTAADGQGLQNSSTLQAQYLVAKRTLLAE